MVKKFSRKDAQVVTRTRLIEVAAQMFARHGFEKTSVDAIAEEVGMTKGAVYANFATKEDLFFAVLDGGMNQQDQVLETILAEPAQMRLDALRSYLTQMFASNHDWRLLVTEFWLHAARKPALREQLALRYQRRRTTIAQFVEQYLALEGRALLLTSEAFVSVIMAMSNGLEMQHTIDPLAIPDDLFATVLTLLLQRLPQ